MAPLLSRPLPPLSRSLSRLRLALPRSLIGRLVGLSLLLLFAVQLAGFAVVRATIDRNARIQIEGALDGDARAWQRVLGYNAERLQQAAALLAADYGFRSAVLSGDVDTMQSVLDNHGRRIGAAVSALLDDRMSLVSASVKGGASAYEVALGQAVPLLASGEKKDSRIVVVGGTPYQFVMVPMRAPLVIGWVVMGFPISQAQALELQQLRSAEVALLVTAADGSLSVPVSSLTGEVVERLRRAGPVGELHTEHGDLLARTVRMESLGGQVQAVILRSVNEVVAPYRRLQVMLGIVTLIGVLLFAAANGWMAHRLTVPLRSLIAATLRMADGDYAVPMGYTRRRDEIGNLARAFDRMRLDIAEQQVEIQRMALTDRLTGLPNREHFRALLVKAMAPGPGGGTSLAVLSLDLDRFKHVNGVLGYGMGDQLLQAVADRIGHQVRSGRDVLARLGGNAFALLLPGATAEEAGAVAQRIARAFETPLALGDQTLDVSAGIGIACWPGPASDADTLLSHAEIAMYAAKQRLSGAMHYDTAMDSSSPESLSMLTDLRHAIDHGELRLYLQPKVALNGWKGCAAEALLRWQHPERGLVPPMQFIPFAEQTGFVRHLTLWVFAETARLLARPEVRATGLRVSVNLSTRDLLDPELHQKLGDLLSQHGVAAESFCLEITESAIMDDPQRAEAMLNRLSGLGFRLSIDDFGTGYSSLGYLRRLPVDELKIDKSFVLGMVAEGEGAATATVGGEGAGPGPGQGGGQGHGDVQIVRSTIDLAHNLGLTVVAEGVETEAVMQRLKDLGCDDAQGYFISRPLPLADFLAWLRRPREAAAATGATPPIADAQTPLAAC